MARGPRLGPRVKDERAYAAALRREILIPMRAQARLRIVEAQDSYMAIRQSLNAVRDDIRLLAPAEVEARRALERTAARHKARFTKLMRRFVGVRVDLLTDTPLDLRTRVAENVDLIRTIPKRFHDSLAQGLTDLAASEPFDQAKVMRLLSKEYRSAGYNVRRLTRDQTSKLVGQLNHARQTEVGVQSYEWVTAGDERVRPSHIANGGQTFRWDDPPATGHPGSDILCRCVAVAVIPDPPVVTPGPVALELPPPVAKNLGGSLRPWSSPDPKRSPTVRSPAAPSGSR